MNIIVKPYGGGLCECRPDTTWERENKDLYIPGCVSEVHWSPIIFARVSKAGKCVSGKFASRYYDAFGFGALLYCRVGEEGPLSSCVDHSSLLPFPLYNTVVMDSTDNIYEVWKDGNMIFRTPDGSESFDYNNLIEEGICKASQLTSLRIGDMIAIELKDISLLASQNGSETAFKATYCENDLYDLKIIF